MSTRPPSSRRSIFLPLIVVLLSANSCDTQQQADIAANAGSLQFVAIEPGNGSSITELYTLAGDMSIDKLLISEAAQPAAIQQKRVSEGDHELLRILHINDMHHHLADRSGETTEYRAARISQLVQDRKRAAAENETVLFVSAGDDAAGTGFDELIGYSPEEFVVHAGYATYSVIGMDVGVLGNHEFDWGLDLLQLSAKKSASFPLISTNVLSSNDNWPVHGALLGVIGGFRVAFLGFTPPDDLPVRALRENGVTVMAVAEQVGKLLPLIDPYVDAYVVLSHLGFEEDLPDTSGSQSTAVTDTKLAELLSGVTTKPAIIIGGHTHTVLNKSELEERNVISGIPILQAGEFGKWLGEARMELANIDGTISASYRAHLIGITANTGDGWDGDTGIDSDLQDNVIAPMQRMLDERFKQVIGHVADDAVMSANQTAIDRYTNESALMNLFTDAVVESSSEWPSGQVDFAMLNATSISDGLDAGDDITYGTLYDIFPYSDTVYVLRLTGQQLKDILQNNAARIWQQNDFNAQGQQRDPHKYHESGFLHFSAGIRYSVASNLQDGTTVARDMQLNGIPIDNVLNRQFTLAVPSYVAIGRGRWGGDSVRFGNQGSADGFDMRELTAASGHDTGRVWRKEVLTSIKRNGGEISTQTGAVTDGRLQLTDATRQCLLPAPTARK